MLENTFDYSASIPLSIVHLGLTLKFPNPLLLKIANNVLISIKDVLSQTWYLQTAMVSLNKIRKIVVVQKTLQ